jgi:hypothetical protein
MMFIGSPDGNKKGLTHCKPSNVLSGMHKTAPAYQFGKI